MCRCFFFFSSRRRHTRFKCDWSSDVCSSDLRVIVFANQFVDTITLLPAPFSVLARLLLNRVLLRIHILRFEYQADFVEDARNVVGKMPIGEIVGMLYVGVTEHELHPVFGELLLLLTHSASEALQGAGGELAHARDP